ncbi:AraC family transcriptional regulator (plasmid) [Escherichia coli]|uniref:helix-turn-helix domain-containing protein n=1 Tax=Enterobacteriaceae TaxID=543 RepID=UPI000972FFD7|nr:MULTISPECIES: AraC family transcriptional regulator [Enterobacteriaceae]EFC4279355.1 helix-turn-helix transcriptional regulator [Escherichia coli]EFK6687624.1 helix-turn-helix transcriptional regulator [Escherichia coli]MDS1455446.1 AraC family transcriptional regulator [Escherichia coli]MDS1461130.1 AraC family transcriptional regulator [Escherichia coli]SJA44923.1 DNA-binding transcriptional activator FeaR [Shigella sonnei]
MMKIKELSAAHSKGLEEWGKVIKKDLGFAHAIVSTPEGVETDLFSGQMQVDELNNGTLCAKVNSSSQRTTLIHKNVLNKSKTKFLIINSCNSILIKNQQNRKVITPGDSIIVPAWDKYMEESFSGRTSLSLIIDVSSVTDSVELLSKLFWKNVSSLTYGFEINKLISNFYTYKTNCFCEKNNSALMSILSLEVEKDTGEQNTLTNLQYDNRFSLILNFIKNNIKNPSLNLSMVANYLGLSERMVQYILNSNGVKFHKLLSCERCLFLESKIRHNKFIDVNVTILDSGFESIATACRQFKYFYNITPRQFQKSLID